MKIEGRGVRLTIYIGERDQHHHRPLYHEIVERARQSGLAGATVLRGVEGFGASSRLHTARVLTLSEDLPVVIEIVDRPERIDAFLPALDELVTEGLVVREEVEIILYRGRQSEQQQ
jgi:uncharacterized protein